jgi:hypothetical protein
MMHTKGYGGAWAHAEVGGALAASVLPLCLGTAPPYVIGNCSPHHRYACPLALDGNFRHLAVRPVPLAPQLCGDGV